MKHLLLTGLVSAALGAAAAWFFLEKPDPPQPAGRTVSIRDIRDVPPMSLHEAASHRQQRFASIETIEEMLALPSDFDQTEALYVVAGRSDSAQLQNLIDQANRIADESDRQAALSILFSRLTDIDPNSAVAMAGRPPFSSERSIESAIWRTWSRYDLDAALQAALELTPLSRRNTAAQSIYAAHGYMGNDTTQRIEDILGIAPSRWVKSQYLQSLAADSPAAAMEYLNDLRPMSEQSSAAQIVGQYLGRTQPEAAESYSHLITNRTARTQYDSALLGALASSDPAKLLDRWIANPSARKYAPYASTALAQLAATDPDRAIGYYHAVQDSATKRGLANGILQVLARGDPEKALAWARENEIDTNRSLYHQAIMAIAAVNPDLAMQEVGKIPEKSMRSSLVAVVIASMAQSDPETAVAALEQLPPGTGKRQAARQLMATWAQFDAEAATAWAVENAAQYGAQMLRQAANSLINQNPEAAIQLLPQLDRKTAEGWSVQIARTLFYTRSPEVALAFVEQHKGSSAYPQMQAALIPQIAQTDITSAKNMADGMKPGAARDSVYAQLIGRASTTDPQLAIAWLDSIERQQTRGQAVSGLVSSWMRTDPASASRWVSGLAAGTERDHAVSALVSNASDVSDTQLALINSIGNDQTRMQAAFAAVQRLALGDPQRLASVLQIIQLTDEQRAQIESVLEQYPQNVYFD